MCACHHPNCGWQVQKQVEPNWTGRACRGGLIESTPTRLMKVLQIGNSLRAHDFCSTPTRRGRPAQHPKKTQHLSARRALMFSAQVHSHCTLAVREHVVQIKNQENAITSFCSRVYIRLSRVDHKEKMRQTYYFITSACSPERKVELHTHTTDGT